MKRFRHILVSVADSADGTPALDQAVAVARESGAALTLTRVLEPPRPLFRAVYPQADELHAVLVREWSERLEALAEPLRAEGLDVTTRLLQGTPFLELTRTVIEHGHDLLVKPPSDPAEGTFFGSTDLHLLRKCPCAVWITAVEPPTGRGILALVDPGSDNPEMNDRILQMADSLRQLRGGTLEVLHVWDARGEQLLANRVSGEELEEYLRETRARSASALESTLARAGVSAPADQVHLVKGDVRFVVPELVRSRDVGLVVMGTVCRTGIHGVLIGNTAEDVLARVQCPVLTVKPVGFESPIEARALAG